MDKSRPNSVENFEGQHSRISTECDQNRIQLKPIDLSNVPQLSLPSTPSDSNSTITTLSPTLIFQADDYFHNFNVQQKNFIRKHYHPLTAKRIQKPTFEQIYDCIITENIEQLRKFVLDSYGGQIYSTWKNSSLICSLNVVRFLESIPAIQRKIHLLNNAISGDGSLQFIKQHLLDDNNLELLLSRDPFTGIMPLHRAVLYQREDLLQQFVHSLPCTLDLCDNQGRTALHLAALLPEGQGLQMYRQLVQLGANTSTTDMYLRRPVDYLREDELRQLFLSDDYLTEEDCQNPSFSSSPSTVNNQHIDQQSINNGDWLINGHSGQTTKLTVNNSLNNNNNRKRSKSNVHHNHHHSSSLNSPLSYGNNNNYYRYSANGENFPNHCTKSQQLQQQQQHQRYSIGSSTLNNNRNHSNNSSNLNLNSNTFVVDGPENNSTEQYFSSSSSSSNANQLNLSPSAVFHGYPLDNRYNQQQQHLPQLQYNKRKTIQPTGQQQNNLPILDSDNYNCEQQRLQQKNDVHSENHWNERPIRKQTSTSYPSLLLPNVIVGTSPTPKTSPQHRPYRLGPSRLPPLLPHLKSSSSTSPRPISPISPSSFLIPHSPRSRNTTKTFSLLPYIHPTATSSETNPMNNPPTTHNRILNIKEIIRQGNLAELEELVLKGYGEKLLLALHQQQQQQHPQHQHSGPLVQEFLDNLPNYLDQINELHKAACHGNVREFQLLLDRYSLIVSRDPLGCTPLHKSVLYGHYELSEFIASNFGPTILYLGDNERRTPLHYAAGLAGVSGGGNSRAYSKSIGDLNELPTSGYGGGWNDDFCFSSSSFHHHHHQHIQHRNDDNHNIYRSIYQMFLRYSPKSAHVLDQKNRTADYYLRYPEQLNIENLMKRSKRLNANYTINLANRIKLIINNNGIGTVNADAACSNHKLPLKRKERSLSPNWNSRRIHPGENDYSYQNDQHHNMNDSDPGTTMDTTQTNGVNMSPKMEISSANLKKWIEENNIEMMEGAVLEGHGERLRQKAQSISQSNLDLGSQSYIEETVPQIMNKIQNIHAAVSMGDLSVLQEGLEKKRDYILSKDHLGMTPLHKATIMGHVEVVQYILEKFPETVNAKDREGRTALHYSTATTNRNGNKIYKMLLKAGADHRVRDSHGKTPDYYRVHLLPILNETLGRTSGKNGMVQTGPLVGATGKFGESNATSKMHHRTSNQTSQQQQQPPRHIQPAVREKINQALHNGNVSQLEELLLDGYGQELIGRTSFNDDARKFLKSIPQSMETIHELHDSVSNGDEEQTKKILLKHPQYVKTRDQQGFTPFHLATMNGHLNLVNHMAEFYPNIINLKDNLNRNALHLASIAGHTDIYRRLIELSFDPKSIDQKGKTAEHYLKMNNTVPATEISELLALGAEAVKPHPVQAATISNRQTLSKLNKTTNASGGGSSSPANDNNIIGGNISPTAKKLGAKPSRLPALPGSTKSKQSNDPKKELQKQKSTDLDSSNESTTGSTATDSANDDVSQPEKQSSSEEPQTEQSDENVSNGIITKDDDDEVKESDASIEQDENGNSQRMEQNQNDGTTINDDDDDNDDDGTNGPSPINEDNKIETEHETNKINSETDETTNVDNEDQIEAPIEPEPVIIYSKANNGEVLWNKIEEVVPETDSDIAVDASGAPELDETNVDDVAAEIVEENAEKTESPTSTEETVPSVDVEATSPLNVGDFPTIPEEPKLEEIEAEKIETDKEQTKSNEGDQPVETDNIVVDNENVSDINNNDDLDASDSMEQQEPKDSADVNVEPETEQEPGQTEETTTATTEADQSSKENENDNVDRDNNEDDDKGQEEKQQNDKEKIEEKEIDPQGNTDENNGEPKSTDDAEQQQPDGKETEEEKEEKTDEIKPDDVDGAEEMTKNNQTNGSNEDETKNINNTESVGDEKENVQPETEKPETEVVEPSAPEDLEDETENPDKEEKPDNSEQSTEVPFGSEAEMVAETATAAILSGVGINIIEEKNTNEQDNEKTNANDPETENQNSSDPVEQDEQKLQNLMDNASSNRNSARSNVSNMNHDRLNELIKGWLEDGDLIRLEHVVIAGQGHRLLNETSESKQVQDFLNLVPAYMAKIARIHESVVQGNVDEVQKTLTRKRFALCRDQYGNSPLHLAVLHGHVDILLHIITQFPETIDGPDNDGRTPFHYSAVLPDKQIYQILETAGANGQQKDRHGYTPVDYLTNGKLSIRDLLIKYSTKNNHKQQQNDSIANSDVGTSEPSSTSPPITNNVEADLWERPPTSEIVSQLTPESGSAPSSANGDDLANGSVPGDSSTMERPSTVDLTDQRSTMNKLSTTANSSTGSEVQVLQIEPRQFDLNIAHPIINGNESNGLLAPPSQEIDDLNNSSLKDKRSNFKRMETFDSSSKKLQMINNGIVVDSNDKSPVDDQIFETMSTEFNRSLINEKLRLQQSIDEQIQNSDVIKNGQHNGSSVIDSIQKSTSQQPGAGQQTKFSKQKQNGISASGYDLTQIKDEQGRTVLHLAAAKDQKRNIFYKILQQAKYLVPELDSKYRTIRDVAVQNGIKNNLQVIDKFIIDCYLNEDEEYLKVLLLEGYSTLLTVVDTEGNDVISLLNRSNKNSMQKFVHEAAELQRMRDELHTFIRNGYQEGVNNLVENNPLLVIAKSNRGRTSLHLAVLFGNLDIIETLINVNQQVINTPDNLGRTPLHYAMAMSKMEEIGRILIHSGANKAIRDVKMRTPSYYFVYKQDIRDIKREEQNLTI